MSGHHVDRLSGAESGQVRIGDSVAVFAQGPIGLCATAGARLMGASTIIGVEAVPARMETARQMGADRVVDFTRADPVEEIMRLTDGRGVDVAIEALGRQDTFESALRVLRPGGTLSWLETPPFCAYRSTKVVLATHMLYTRASIPERSTRGPPISR